MVKGWFNSFSRRALKSGGQLLQEQKRKGGSEAAAWRNSVRQMGGFLTEMVFHTLEWMWGIYREVHGVLERSQALKALTRHTAFEICKLGWDSDLKTLCLCLEKLKWYIYLTALSGGEDTICHILGSRKGLKIGDAYYAGGPDDYDEWSVSTGSHSFTLTVSQEMKPHAYKLSNNQGKGSGYLGCLKELGFLGMEDIFLPPGGK